MLDMTRSNLHVLFLPSWYPKSPGDVTGSFFREQAIALSQSDVKVGVINVHMLSVRAPHKGIEKIDTAVSAYEDKGIHVYSTMLRNWFFMMPSIRAKQFVRKGLRAFESYIKEHGLPDIIHVHSILYASTLALAIKEKYNVPYIISEHSSSYPRGTVKAKSLNTLRECSKHAERRYGVSENFASTVEQTIGKPFGVWEEMPNSVSDEFLKYPIQDKAKNEFSFIHVSLMTPNKRVEGIIRAFHEVYKVNPHVSLTIIGHGQCRDALESLTVELGLSQNINFTGMLAREHVVKQMSLSNAFVLNSEHEPFGVVLIEALALGVPVIATKSGGPDSIVKPKLGYLVDTDDPQALRKAMMNIIEQEGEFNPEDIREFCRLKYSREILVEKWNGIYKEVLGTS